MSARLSPQQMHVRAFERIMELTKTDPQLGALVPSDAVMAAIKTPGASYEQIIDAALRGYADREALGQRAYDVVAGPRGEQVRRHLPRFDTITYAELRRRIEAVASAWRHHPEHRVGQGEFVAIFGFTGTDYLACDLATVYAQAVGAPLQANMGEGELTEILGDIAPAAVVVNIDSVEEVVPLVLAQPSVRSVIVIDADLRVDRERKIVEAARATFEAAGRPQLITFEDLVAYGAGFTHQPLPPHPDGEERLCMLNYTSGSTGTPKGAIYPERISRWPWNGIVQAQPRIALAFAPLNHMMGRNSVVGTLAQGGTVYFTLASDMSTLFDDIRIARPTFLNLIPRVVELIYQHYQAEVLRRVTAGEDEAAADAAVRAEMAKSYLGDRLHFAGVGSAPTSVEARQFIIDCFDVALTEGYGTSEAGGPISAHNLIDRRYITDYRLVDVPELGYFTTDRPYPRGELWIKSKLTIPGYFKRPEASAAIVSEDGWQMTGDIMEERGPDHIVWLDRKNNVLKLSQAEFVAIGPLEATFKSHSALIKQIYVYGNSMRAYLLAVVVPDLEAAERIAGHKPEAAELKAMLMDALKETAREAKLRGFEIPRDIIVELEPFTLENGLLSSVRKPLRPALKRKYGEVLEALYAQMEQKQRDELLALRNPDAGLSVLERIGAALEATLGVEHVDLEKDQTFSDLGGDSLGAVSFAMLLQEIFGIPVPVSAIVSPAASPRRWAKMIETALAGGEQVTFAKVHGEDATEVTADDLDISLFMDPETLAAAEGLSPPRETRTVLLTGASGWLGRFLCLEWLEKLAPLDGKVICLIRAPDDATARRRLEEVYGEVDPVLTARFRELAAGHLEVIAADLAEPRLGLAPELYERLAAEVDHIVHPAAFVNHKLSYRSLFEPNVAGTAELIRLALTSRMKRFDFVSSTAVASLMGDPAEAPEAADVRQARPSVPLSDAYAAGYGASKWAGEILLRHAHESFGLPVDVYRADMILGHTVYRGQLNTPDMFIRMLFSLATTGIAPESFYELDGGKRPLAHYDGLPVDFLAGAMVELGRQRHEGFRTYNMINMHDDDGVSLDAIADWVASAGYPIQRVAPHAAWLERFGMKLRDLPEAQRQQSSLPIIDYFARPHPVKASGQASADFEAAVVKLEVGPDVPHITEAYIHKHLDDMRLIGLLPPPPQGVKGATAAADG